MQPKQRKRGSHAKTIAEEKRRDNTDQYPRNWWKESKEEGGGRNGTCMS
jgi:hypothetical protein